MLGACGFLLLILTLSFPAFCVVKRKKPDWNKRQLLPVFMTFAILASECVQIFLWTVKKSGYEVYQLHLLLVLAAGLLSYRYAGKSGNTFGPVYWALCSPT